MKFSFRQILASAGGAVLAAFIASLFGVKGTIIGVGIGSAAATFGTAFFSQSIERGHEAVKQVVVRSPEHTSLLRRLGGTAAAGSAASSPADVAGVAEDTTTSPSQGDDAMTRVGEAETSVVEVAEVSDATIAMAAVSAADPTAVIRSVSGPSEPVTAQMRVPPRARRSIPWRAIAGTAAVVFVLALALVTGVELLAGHPLSDLFSHTKSGNPSIGQVFGGLSPAPTTTTSTTPPSTTTTSTSSTTTTTAPCASTTSSSDGSGTTTTTTSGTTSTTGTAGTTSTTTPCSSTASSSTTTTPSNSTTTTSGLNLFGTTTTSTTAPTG